MAVFRSRVRNTFHTPWLSLLGWLFFITWLTTQTIPHHSRRVFWFFILRVAEAVSWRRSNRWHAILADAHVFLALPPTHMIKRFFLPFAFGRVHYGGNTFHTPWLSLLGWLFFITWLTTLTIPQHSRRVSWFFIIRAAEAVSWRRSSRWRAILADAHVFLALRRTHMIKLFILPGALAIASIETGPGIRERVDSTPSKQLTIPNHFPNLCPNQSHSSRHCLSKDTTRPWPYHDTFGILKNHL